MDVTVTESTGGGGLTLTGAVGSKVKGVKETLLTWTGASGTSEVFVFRDGVDVAGPISDNAGSHRDVIGKGGGGSYIYKVCEDDQEAICSNQLTVVF